MKQTTFPQHPNAGRKLCTYDDLMDEIGHHFFPGQYVYVEQWTTSESSEDIIEYAMTEGFILTQQSLWQDLEQLAWPRHGEPSRRQVSRDG